MAPRSGCAQVWIKFQVPFEEFPKTPFKDKFLQQSAELTDSNVPY
jgi:hypothetical protein